jgi:2'-hydroxyisoflavone reductase
MRLLVLGGTAFLGRAVVEAALERGHEVTLFNRGRTNAELFPEAEKLRGDRDGDLSALAGRSWDAVVDPSGFIPRVVRGSAELLGDAVEHYTFVSSISVYASRGRLIELDDPTTEDVQQHYGGLKALCERVVDEIYPARSANVRAGLIVGPHDPTGRFTYWPHRIARGGEVLAPGPAERPVQLVDVRDLAAWMLDLGERRIAGTFDATGPTTMGAVVDACLRVAASDATITWVDYAFLLRQGVGEWLELPLWLASPEHRHLLKADASRALAAGLRLRPLEKTVRAALASARPVNGVGLAPERERELLAAWQAHAV